MQTREIWRNAVRMKRKERMEEKDKGKDKKGKKKEDKT